MRSSEGVARWGGTRAGGRGFTTELVGTAVRGPRRRSPRAFALLKSLGPKIDRCTSSAASRAPRGPVRAAWHAGGSQGRAILAIRPPLSHRRVLHAISSLLRRSARRDFPGIPALAPPRRVAHAARQGPQNPGPEQHLQDPSDGEFTCCVARLPYSPSTPHHAQVMPPTPLHPHHACHTACTACTCRMRRSTPSA